MKSELLVIGTNLFQVRDDEGEMSSVFRFSDFSISNERLAEYVRTYEGKSIIGDIMRFISVDFKKASFEKVMKDVFGLDEKIFFLSWLTERLIEEGKSVPILVGGTATEFWTSRNVKSQDIDIVHEDREAVKEILFREGFLEDFPYLFSDKYGILLKVLEAPLKGDDLGTPFIRTSCGKFRVISLEDTILDRLEHYEFGKHKYCLSHAIALIRGNPGSININLLMKNAEKRGLGKYFVGEESILKGIAR